MKKILLFLYSILSFAIASAALPLETLVKTFEGTKQLGAFKVGDRIVSLNKSFTEEESEVTAIEDEEVDETTEITTEDDTVITTSQEQRVFVVQKKAWLKTNELKSGYSLLKQDGSVAKIKQLKKQNKKTILRHITVDGNHNFFTTKEGILVHNFGIAIPAIVAEAGVVFFEAAKVAAIKFAITQTVYKATGKDISGAVDIAGNIYGGLEQMNKAPYDPFEKQDNFTLKIDRSSTVKESSISPEMERGTTTIGKDGSTLVTYKGGVTTDEGFKDYNAAPARIVNKPHYLNQAELECQIALGAQNSQRSVFNNWDQEAIKNGPTILYPTQNRDISQPTNTPGRLISSTPAQKPEIKIHSTPITLPQRGLVLPTPQNPLPPIVVQPGPTIAPPKIVIHPGPPMTPPSRSSLINMKTIEDMVGESTPWKETPKTKQYDYPGTYEDFKQSFEEHNLSGIRDLGDGKKMGYLPNGDKVILRPVGSDHPTKPGGGLPTLEIQRPDSNDQKIKIRATGEKVKGSA